MPTKKKSKKSKPKKLKQFKIPVSWTVWASPVVEAETLEDAIAIVEDPFFPNPTDTDYLDGSFQIDHEILRQGKPYGEIKVK